MEIADRAKEAVVRPSGFLLDILILFHPRRWRFTMQLLLEPWR